MLFHNGFNSPFLYLCTIKETFDGEFILSSREILVIPVINPNLSPLFFNNMIVGVSGQFAESNLISIAILHHRLYIWAIYDFDFYWF